MRCISIIKFMIIDKFMIKMRCNSIIKFKYFY